MPERAKLSVIQACVCQISISFNLLLLLWLVGACVARCIEKVIVLHITGTDRHLMQQREPLEWFQLTGQRWTQQVEIFSSMDKISFSGQVWLCL